MTLSAALAARIRDRVPTVGTWLTLGHTSVAEVLVQAGYDWVVIDTEHSAISTEQLLPLIQVTDLAGAPALVRVGANDPLLIKRAMDAGAAGVVVPMVNSAEEARAAVAAVKYPPHGTRGVGLARAQGYGHDFEAYRDAVAGDSIVVVQIEHIDAVDAIDEILAVPGVDATIIGPYDLSGSLGCPGEFDRPEVADALARYEAACDAAGKPRGVHSVAPDAEKARTYLERGYSLIALGVDFLFLSTLARSAREGLR